MLEKCKDCIHNRDFSEFPIKVGDIFTHYRTEYTLDGLVKPKDEYVVTDICISAEGDNYVDELEPIIIYRNKKWSNNKPSSMRKLSNFFAWIKSSSRSQHPDSCRFSKKVERLENVFHCTICKTELSNDPDHYNFSSIDGVEYRFCLNSECYKKFVNQIKKE